jgi:hypothetical protein
MKRPASSPSEDAVNFALVGHPDEFGNRSDARAIWFFGGLILLLLTHYLASLNASIWIRAIVLSVGMGSILLGLLPTHRYTLIRVIRGWIENRAKWLGINQHQIPFIVFGLALSLASRAAAGDFYVAISAWHGPMWILGAVLLIYGCWQSPRLNTFLRSNWQDLVVLTAVVGVSFFARLISIKDIPYALTGDEGGTGLYALDFTAGKLDNILNVAWYSFPSFYFWLVSHFVRIFGRTIEAIRLLSVVGGTLGIVAIYWTVRVMFSRNLAALSAIFMSAFHFHLLFSRIAIANIWDSTLMTFMIGALWVAWKRNERWAFLLAGIAMGLGQYFYTTSRLMPIYAVLWLVVLFLRAPMKNRTPGLVCLVLTFIVITLPLTFYYIAKPGDFLAPMERVSIFGHDWFTNTSQATGLTPFQLILEQLRKTTLGFSIINIEGVYAPESPMLLTVPAMLFHVGLILTLLRARDPRFAIILIGMLGPVVTGTFSFEPPNSQRLLFAVPWVVLLVTLPLEEIRIQFHEAWPKLFKWGAVVSLTIGLLIAGLELRFFFREAMPQHGYSDRTGILARAIGQYIHELDEPVQIYFLKHPGMSYYALASLPYLADNAVGFDVELPLDSPGNPPISGDNIIFIALSETQEAMEEITWQFPRGETVIRLDQNGNMLFSAYHLQP